MRKAKNTFITLIVFVMFSTCAQSINSQLDTHKIPSSTTIPPTSATSPPTIISEAVSTEESTPDPMQRMINLAIFNLSQSLGIPEEAIEVVSFETVEWLDASLGCPQPGMFYAQLITPGYRIKLGVDGEHYFIHTDLTDTITICENQPIKALPSLPPPKNADDRNPSQPIDPAPTVITD